MSVPLPLAGAYGNPLASPYVNPLAALASPYAAPFASPYAAPFAPLAAPLASPYGPYAAPFAPALASPYGPLASPYAAPLAGLAPLAGYPGYYWRSRRRKIIWKYILKRKTKKKRKILQLTNIFNLRQLSIRSEKT